MLLSLWARIIPSLERPWRALAVPDRYEKATLHFGKALAHNGNKRILQWSDRLCHVVPISLPTSNPEWLSAACCCSWFQPLTRPHTSMLPQRSTTLLYLHWVNPQFLLPHTLKPICDISSLKRLTDNTICYKNFALKIPFKVCLANIKWMLAADTTRSIPL